MAVLSGATASGKQFYQGQLTGSAVTLYTAPANNVNVTSPSSTAYIKEIIITNVSSSSATVSLYLVPSGGSAVTANAFLYNISVNSGDTKFLSGLNIMMPPSSMIQGLGSASSINVTISGQEIQ